jgi:hypothetical protein
MKQIDKREKKHTHIQMTLATGRWDERERERQKKDIYIYRR